MLMLERRLEDRRRRAGIHDAPRLLQRLGHMLMVVRDEMPARIPLPRDLAYFMAGIEDELLRLVGGRGQMAGVEVVPQSQVALAAD